MVLKSKSKSQNLVNQKNRLKLPSQLPSTKKRVQSKLIFI